MNNVFNPPASLQSGQIWHCNALNRNLLITEVDESYNSIGIVRAMVIKNSNILADENEVSIELDELLGLALGKVNVTLRITDGPVCKEDLSFYCGDIPEKYISKVSQAVKKIPSYTEEQMFTINNILDELQPLRERAIHKADESARRFSDSLVEVSLLEQLSLQPEIVYDYGLAAADGNDLEGANAFWKKEKNSELTMIGSEDELFETFLSIVDKGLYFVCYSQRFKSVSNVKLNNGYVEVHANPKLVNFGSEGKVFSLFKEINSLSPGIWELSFVADGRLYAFPLKLS